MCDLTNKILFECKRSDVLKEKVDKLTVLKDKMLNKFMTIRDNMRKDSRSWQ